LEQAEKMYELKRPGRRRKISGELTMRNMQTWKCCGGKTDMMDTS